MVDLYSRLQYIRARIRELVEERKRYKRDQQMVEELIESIQGAQHLLRDALAKGRIYANKLRSLLESKNMKLTVYDEMMEEINGGAYHNADSAIGDGWARSRRKAGEIWEMVDSLSTQIRNLEYSESGCLKEIAAAEEGGSDQ